MADKWYGGDGSISDQLSEMQWRAGLGEKPAHVSAAEDAETLDEAAFLAEAEAIFDQLYGYDRHSPEGKAKVNAAAAEVMAELRKARGVEDIPPSRGLARDLAMRVGNRLYFGASGGNPFPGVGD